MDTASYIPNWKIIYGGTNVIGNLQSHATRVRYDEALGGKASVCEITVENVPSGNNAAGVWIQNPPKIGTALNLSIGYQGADLVSCGDFQVDEWEAMGPPDTFVLRAIQAGVTHAIRTPKSAWYENTTLLTVAKKIAAIHGLTVKVEPSLIDVSYQRLTQHTESDLGFLHRLANAHNYEFTIYTGSVLYFYSRPQLESAAPPNDAIRKTYQIRYRVHEQHIGDRSYGKAVVTHFDPLSKKLLSAYATDPNANSSDTLNIIERIENQQQAALRAQAHLHAANMHTFKAEIDLPGTMLYRAGNTTYLSGFGRLDTVKFVVDEAKHTVDRRGWRTVLHLRTTISGAASETISNDYGGE